VTREDQNALSAFAGAAGIPGWQAVMALSPAQQLEACDLLREVMHTVEETVSHDLALRIEEFLTESSPRSSALLQ
jgi:hypothetical protein